MFYPIENGSVYEVPDNAFGFIFHCNVPPIGYGVNSITGKLQKTDIIKRSEIEQEQYWERYHLPKNWQERREVEKRKQEIDKYYFDPELEQIRQREWKRRLCGVWFWNYNPKKGHSECLYITGTHYLYSTYWKFQGKFMDFRINDMELWYVVKYCETDPNCLGINEITKRKLGKTARLGCWLFERTSRPPFNQHAGLQSKADDDAEEVMKKAIVQPWQKLPDFFRPTYDIMKGDDPSELRFFHASRRGSSVENALDSEPALESWIDFGASGEAVYDGPELDSYGSDESGKTKRPVSIKERQNVVRYCAEIDGNFHEERDGIIRARKQWYTTTVEIEKDKKGVVETDNDDFQDMTANSNPMERDANGRTGTGLYTYFLPAQKGMRFDKYGFPNEEEALQFINNTIEAYLKKNDLRGLSSFKRKNPRFFKEAFSVDGIMSLYNPELLNIQLDAIGWNTKLTEFGDLKWKDGFEFERPVVKDNGEIEYELNEVVWEPNPNGRFEKVVGWWPKDSNKVYKNGSKYLPNNNWAYRIGCDPFKYDKTKENRRSNCAAFAYQIKDELCPDDEFNDMFTLRYAFRANSTRESNMDILMMAWLCGCQVLFERNVNHWKNDFKDADCDAFLMYLPGEVEPGMYSDGAGTTVQLICRYTEAYQNEFIKKVRFKTLLRKVTGWLGFKVEDTQKYDEPMAAGFTLIGVKGKRYVKPNQQMQDIESVMPLNKAT